MLKLNHHTQCPSSASRTIMGLLTLLLTLLPGCLPSQKVVALPDPPALRASRSELPAAVPRLAPTLPPDVTAPSLAPEKVAAVVTTPAAPEPTESQAVAAATAGEPAGGSPVAERDDEEGSPQLIGPLRDPIFEPPTFDAATEQPEEIVTDEDPGDPLLSGELEPLNIEEIPLPGPNDFGSLEGAQADTSNIGDLAEISDPDTQYDLPVVLNEQVEFFLDQYLTSHRKVFEHWLARSGRFLPMIQEELAKAGLPQDLCYLPMIESGFRVTASSPAKAVGAWQFIPGTAKLYGLTVNKEIDERRDPVKSTRAAIRFLSDLYADFQSWPLAIAAYNAGGGRIRTAVEKTGSSDFWELAKSRYLVAETKYYVPKLLAAIIVAKNPEKYGFDTIDYEPPLAYETIRVPKATHLAAVALAAGTDLEEIYSLNRQLRRAVTPSDQRFCELCVPVGTSELIARNLPLVRATITTSYKTHQVKKGETADRLSRRYGISKKTLLQVNNLREAKLSPGRKLRIPVQSKSYKLVDQADRRVAANRTPEGVPSTREPILHKVQAGDSLFQLARRYNVSMAKIAARNNLRDPRRLSVGQTLEIYLDDRAAANDTPSQAGEPLPTEQRIAAATPGADSEPATFYKVRNGDTILEIAKKFQTTPEKIRAWNSLNDNTVRPGLRLRLEKTDDSNA